MIIKEKVPRDEFFVRVIGDDIDICTFDLYTTISLPNHKIFDVSIKYKDAIFYVYSAEEIEFTKSGKIQFYQDASDEVNIDIIAYMSVDMNKYNITIKKNKNNDGDDTINLMMIISENDI